MGTTERKHAASQPLQQVEAAFGPAGEAAAAPAMPAEATAAAGSVASAASVASGASPPQASARAGRSRAPTARVSEQPAFVLHSHAHRETSLILDVFSRDHGRIALIAKGAKRPHSALRGVLQTFQPLSLSWSGRAEMRTLTRAEWVGGMLPLRGDALVCGFYVNELMVRLCAREDPHPVLFQHYVVTLTRLAHAEPAAAVLRSFEVALLRESGYAVGFEGDAPAPEDAYVFDPERGARLARGSDPQHWPVIAGRTLIDIVRDDFSDPRTVLQSRNLMRFLLNHHLGGAPLNTRQILIDLQKL